jgi:hypothetical protein
VSQPARNQASACSPRVSACGPCPVRFAQSVHAAHARPHPPRRSTPCQRLRLDMIVAHAMLHAPLHSVRVAFVVVCPQALCPSVVSTRCPIRIVCMLPCLPAGVHTLPAASNAAAALPACAAAGHRSRLPHSLPLKRGMLHYAYSRKMPVQVRQPVTACEQQPEASQKVCPCATRNADCGRAGLHSGTAPLGLGCFPPQPQCVAASRLLFRACHPPPGAPPPGACSFTPSCALL